MFWGWLLRAALLAWVNALFVDKETLIRVRCLASCPPVKCPLSPGRKINPVCAEVPVSLPGAPGVLPAPAPAWQHQGHCCAREGVT